jgi:ankyrin repeat protein
MVRKLLAEGAYPHARDDDGSTALYVAFTYSDSKMKAMLL